MSEELQNSRDDETYKLLDQERQRFIREQRLRPKLWLRTAWALTKFVKFVLTRATIALLILPPAIFYWLALFASSYEITALIDILAHVGVGTTPISGNGVSQNETVSSLSVDNIGITIWLLVGASSMLIICLLLPMRSPIQKATDKHMMRCTTPGSLTSGSLTTKKKYLSDIDQSSANTTSTPIASEQG
ncbi:hypothetical protein [Microbulbifer epialgicus]|uniref:Uncharacterized protein n=1 Tax=Microbulbifer epialgicus TaxID=393907 RepID=A0ABV4NTY1_9GAMM